MKAIREAIADALGIKPDDLGCFTLTDHDEQPAILIMHGGEYQGIWIENEARSINEGPRFYFHANDEVKRLDRITAIQAKQIARLIDERDGLKLQLLNATPQINLQPRDAA